MNTLQKITCPICHKKNTWRPENTHRPFCSDRCKLIDLGEWANETRRIPADPVDPNPGAGFDSATDSEDNFL